MTKTIIPADTHLAAKRGFVRTAAQSLATGFIVPAGVTFGFTQDFLLAAGVGLAGLVVSAVANGAQSYFDIISKGIPEVYQDTVANDGEGFVARP